ncbi:thiamine diphosphate-binding protein [Fusarium oxysporum II5]|nr:thiamine diphosphate-binding protein [Fusarium oxysporum II5]
MTFIKLADYLFTRLRQLGVGSIHGIPAGLRWAGNTNKLNAAYAADGYARIEVIRVIITTFGVRELSAINTIADVQGNRILIHHTSNDSEFCHFSAMHAYATVTQAGLDNPRTSAEKIDETLKQYLLYSRPVYIEVPVDMVVKPVSRLRPESPSVTSEGEKDEASDAVFRLPAIVVSGETRPIGIRESVQVLIKFTGWAFYESSDLVLFFSPHLSSSNSHGYSNKPESDVGILFTTKGVQIGGQLYRGVYCKQILSGLSRELDHFRVFPYENYPQLPRDTLLQIPANPSDKPILKTTWLLESGDYFGLPSTKTVLFIGEGSFQMTVQEITSIVRHSLDVTIFVINNDGCPIDRSTHGRLFGAKEVIYTRSAKTWRDLKHVLEDEGLLRGKELRMVEIFLGREDFPKGPLLHYLEAQRQAE